MKVKGSPNDIFPGAWGSPFQPGASGQCARGGIVPKELVHSLGEREQGEPATCDFLKYPTRHIIFQNCNFKCNEKVCAVG